MSALIHRAKTVCTSKKTYCAEMKKITEDLVNNGYPVNFIRKIERRITRQKNAECVTEEVPRESLKKVSFPYIPNVSENVARICRGFGLEILHKPYHQIRSILKNPTDPCPPRQVVYKIPCDTCNRAYIGETKNFKQRMSRHKSEVKNAACEENALADHCWNEGPNVNWNGISILARESNMFKRRCLESWFIRREHRNLSRNVGSLPGVYYQAL